MQTTLSATVMAIRYAETASERWPSSSEQQITGHERQARETMARWEMIAKNVKYSRHQPPAEYVADTYRCTNCGNKVNDRTELPKDCPWCSALMTTEGSNK